MNHDKKQELWQQLTEPWTDLTAFGLRQKLINHIKRKSVSASHAEELAEDCVAEAFDIVVERLTKGTKITNLSSYLYKVTERVAFKRIREEENLISLNETLNDTLPDANPVFSNTIWDEREEQRARLIKVALDHAWRLLPKIGTGQIQDVMHIFLEAVEARIEDISPSMIAESLGIGTASARTLLHRGQKRLRRVAEEEGIVIPSWFGTSIEEPFTALSDTHSNEEDNQ